MSDPLQRRRRAADAGAEEEALAQLERELQEERLANPDLEAITTEPEVRGELTVQELPAIQDDARDLETPKTAIKDIDRPLFTPKQVEELEKSQAMASHLYAGGRGCFKALGLWKRSHDQSFWRVSGSRRCPLPW